MSTKYHPHHRLSESSKCNIINIISVINSRANYTIISLPNPPNDNQIPAIETTVQIAQLLDIGKQLIGKRIGTFESIKTFVKNKMNQCLERILQLEININILHDIIIIKSNLYVCCYDIIETECNGTTQLYFLYHVHIWIYHKMLSIGNDYNAKKSEFGLVHGYLQQNWWCLLLDGGNVYGILLNGDISGEQHFMKLYVGIEPIEPISSGHNGCIDGIHYFQCKDSSGMCGFCTVLLLSIYWLLTRSHHKVHLHHALQGLLTIIKSKKKYNNVIDLISEIMGKYVIDLLKLFQSFAIEKLKKDRSRYFDLVWYQIIYLSTIKVINDMDIDMDIDSIHNEFMLEIDQILFNPNCLSRPIGNEDLQSITAIYIGLLKPFEESNGNNQFYKECRIILEELLIENHIKCENIAAHNVQQTDY